MSLTHRPLASATARPSLCEVSQGRGCARPALEGTYNGSFLWAVGISRLIVVKLLFEILLDSAELLDRCTNVRTVNDVNLDKFANPRESSAASAVLLGIEVTHPINLYGTRVSLGRDLIERLATYVILN